MLQSVYCAFPDDKMAFPLWEQTLCEGVAGTGIDSKCLNFSVEADLGKDRQGRKALNLEPASAVDEATWLASLSELSSLELAKRLGVTDRQVRRIRAGKVSTARLREHAKADAERTIGRTSPVP